MRAGTNLGHYVIAKKIGSGGMGDVYLADDTKLDRKVAIKVLLSEVAKDRGRIDRFIHEAKAASALNHPNILTIFEVGESDGSHFIVTELVTGVTLRDLMKAANLDVRRKLDICIQTASALEAAHQHGIIHRDIKPDNVMVRPDGLVKVLDFGLAKLKPDNRSKGSESKTLKHHNTEPGTIVGTAAYMSPEQARGQGLDERTDLFSLGIVFYELFTGRQLFRGDTNADTISSILKDEVPQLRQVKPDLPRQLERIIAKLLRKDREYRYQHIRDLRIDLEDLQTELRQESGGSYSNPAPESDHLSDQERKLVTSAFTSQIVEKRRFTLLHAAIFGVGSLALFAGVWLVVSKLYMPPPLPGSYPTRELAAWSSAAGEMSTHGSFSPDGKMFAFSSTKSGSLNIWITQTTAPRPIQVTNDLAANSDPVWSPDGTEIAFFSDPSRTLTESGRPSGISRVPALGGGAPRLIAEVKGGTPQLRRWTASGSVYFQLSGNLYKLDVASGRTDQITSFEGTTAKWIDISADEKQIASLTKSTGAWKIAITDLDGGNPEEIFSGSGDVGRAAWLEGKKRFLYEARVSGVMQVFAVDYPSGQARSLTAGDTDSFLMDASADGSSFAAGSAREESNIWLAGVAEQREVPIVKDIDVKLWPVVSPDGKWVAYQSIRNLSSGDKLFYGSILVKATSPTTSQVPPKNISGIGYLPAWSPDGRKVAFLRRSQTDAAIYIADPDSGVEAQEVTTGVPTLNYSISPYNPVQARVFAWAPDGASIAYASAKGGASNIWTASFVSSADHPLTENSDGQKTFYPPVYSTDGKSLAYLTQTKGPTPEDKGMRLIEVIDIASRQSSRLFQSSSVLRILGFSSDDRVLLIAEGTKEFSGSAQNIIIRSLSLAGGEQKEIARIPNVYFYNTFLSDDKKMIAYAARENGLDDIWKLSASGGIPRKLTSNNDGAQYFSRLAWLHDGSAIVFGKQTRFSLVSLTTGIDQ